MSMKPLVVYYSRTGVTRKVAEDISSILKCPVDEIIDETKRNGIIGWLFAGRDALQKRLTKISGLLHEPAEHDIVFIGTPVWAGNMAPAVREYITKYKDSIKKLAVFCTFGGSGETYTVLQIEELTGMKAVSTLGLRSSEVSKKEHLKKISDFVDEALRSAAQ